MKTRYKTLLGILLLALPALMFLSCGDDEDITPVAELSDLVIEKEQVKILVGDKAELEIVKGNNDYKAFSLNEEIATVGISGNKLIIDALERGNTSVIVSDGSAQYRSIGIITYYDAIKVENEAVKMMLPLGTFKTKSVAILQGNGDYRAESSDEEIVFVRTSGESLLITGRKEGKASITLTDALDITTTIQVEVISTTDPYDESELDAIMKKETLSYVFNNSVEENATTYFTPLNRIENGRNLYGWDYYNFYYLKIYFSGDKEVGKKENASLVYRYGSTSISADHIDFEIIKNDGNKIWAVYSFIRLEVLHYGYFIQNINP
ncbi:MULTISPECIES: hypothetical protein [unclassified Proteiniphilum]|jgi:hypothetical protein|uniref:hypothetical protein n=1 Tax=Proteiniphilum sp. UBA1028 TaxID=1947251 RepID=UPI002581115F|nr:MULTISPECIES: hypothetical protein [unclassified Proteiniphilum]MDD2246913.1 hypothetical protein [Proteiniphilum sp.]MDD4416668.1 hypothetical protein [Proteiniphilum sp.]